jgi:lipopolysaccharide/colanic/teichoic acid biosynthesis glycosyltransferase
LLRLYLLQNFTPADCFGSWAPKLLFLPTGVIYTGVDDMLSNSLHPDYSQGLAVSSRVAVGATRRATAGSLNGSPVRSFRLFIAEFFSEYILGNALLAFILVSSRRSPNAESLPLQTRVGRFFKRGIDIVGSLVGLALTSPLFLLLPIVIKLDSPGPIFYRQSRVGHNRRRGERRAADGSRLGRSPRDRRRSDLLGRPIQVIKFRTMVADAERKCGPVWATKNDPRITRLGHFLRKTRMDEIPQFINVLKGDMSLVGPRPERPMFVRELCSQVENYDKRLTVKPGLTGLAQIENGYDCSVTSVVRKVHYDLEYINTWSLWQDAKILMKTVVVVVTGKGAF